MVTPGGSDSKGHERCFRDVDTVLFLDLNGGHMGV